MTLSSQSLRFESCKCRRPVESMKVCNQCQAYFFTLTQGHLNIKIKIMVFLGITEPMKVKLYVETPCFGENNYVHEIRIECST